MEEFRTLFTFWEGCMIGGAIGIAWALIPDMLGSCINAVRGNNKGEGHE
tara:strand:+ start:386 stop:532 length:147 start_codon:yes stop_codon:yes gene_type:complete